MSGGPAQPQFPTPPSSRTYVHRACGQVTYVDGEHFEGLCNPFTGLFGVSTLCTSCSQQRPLSEFAWQDTGEALDRYRKRLRGAAPAGRVVLDVLSRVLAFFGLPAAGALIGYWIADERVVLLPIVGAVVGFVVGVVIAGLVMAADTRDYTRYR